MQYQSALARQFRSLDLVDYGDFLDGEVQGTLGYVAPWGLEDRVALVGPLTWDEPDYRD
jgi:hypothetical protein